MNAAYAVVARNADMRDQTAQMAGKPEDATHRDELDRALGIADLLGDEETQTNVVELQAWVEHVNRTMR